MSRGLLVGDRYWATLYRVFYKARESAGRPDLRCQHAAQDRDKVIAVALSALAQSK